MLRYYRTTQFYFGFLSLFCCFVLDVWAQIVHNLYLNKIKEGKLVQFLIVTFAFLKPITATFKNAKTQWLDAPLLQVEFIHTKVCKEEK